MCTCSLLSSLSLCVNSALVPSSNIRPVDTNVQALGVKRTSGFVRACGELARHQELVARRPLNSDESSDEPDSLNVAASRRKVKSRVILQLLRFVGCKASESVAQSLWIMIYSFTAVTATNFEI